MTITATERQPRKHITRSAGLRVVAIGGGTGLSTLLRGLKRYAPSAAGTAASEKPHPISDLTAVVTVTDDGGSSGRLRKNFNMLPPGDLRNCMVALSEDEGLISQLFRHRFQSGGELEGHNFGNLFVAALTEMTGDFGHAIRLAGEVLAMRGVIYPATYTNTTLVARMASGAIVRGETNITASKDQIFELSLDPPVVEPLPETLAAIANADLITLGPGSLYTSLITNLLVEGIPEALAAAHGTRVYIANLMTQSNESLHLSASEHIERIYKHTGQPVFDYALINTAPVPESIRERYAAEGAEVIQPDVARIEAMGIRCITGNFAAESDVLRHDAPRVAQTLLELGGAVILGEHGG
ncbi:MAG TPA: gluconeogenesis factor YvcK family protein [Acidobacteriaceae bacterium]|nr:gluconeogenesis factor YvcK family protein [Acidobacteriaceae bacterium]